MTLTAVEQEARDELRDRWTNYREDFAAGCESDVIHEIADSCVPVYTSQLLELANEDNGLATEEPELGPAFDGTPTPVNIIAANIYERLTAALWDALREFENEETEQADRDEEAMRESGEAAGKAAGSWVSDGNSTDEHLRGVLRAIEECEFEIPAPFSGEWSDSWTPARAFEEADVEQPEDDEEAAPLLDAWEDGFRTGYEEQAAEDARGFLPSIREGYPHPIAYTFEADTHCPGCTAKRFGTDAEGFIPEDARDNEGNPVGAIAPWDEWHEPGEELPQVLACSTCGGEIERLDAEDGYPADNPLTRLDATEDPEERQRIRNGS